jgi:hypothetical protein
LVNYGNSLVFEIKGKGNINKNRMEDGTRGRD